jgi:DNA-binding CsgD family transcriptional regulator
MKLDVISAVEACYEVASPEDAWLRGIFRALEPLDRGSGILGTVFTLGAGGAPLIDSFLEHGTVPAGLSAGLVGLTRTASARVFAPVPPVIRIAQRAAMAGSATRREVAALFGRFGAKDSIAVAGHDPPCRVVVVGVGIMKGERTLPPRILNQLSFLSAHLTSGLRLRSRLAAVIGKAVRPPDAVLEPDGALVHAESNATSGRACQQLSNAVRRLDCARGALRRTSPEEALRLWQGLVNGTWSLVDQCDSDGKRWVLAHKNPPNIRDPRALSPLQRSIVAFACLGHQDKYISYMLGVSRATVSLALNGARRKLGLRSRAELIRRLAPLMYADPTPSGE